MNRTPPAPEHFSWSGTPRQRLRAQKRLEAEARNAETPHERRRMHRKQRCACYWPEVPRP